MPGTNADRQTFDSHEYLEAVLRYSPNADYYRMFRDNVYGEHLAVGFGGGTYLLSALTELPYFHGINYSRAQLANGQAAGPKLVSLFNYHLQHGSLDLEILSEQFPETSSLGMEEKEKIIKDIGLTIEVIREKHRVPAVKNVIGACGYFKNNTEFYHDNQFDTLDVGDLLPHIPRDNVPDIFSEIRRVLKPGGDAVVTYFPSSRYPEGCECADSTFLRMAEEFGIGGTEIYDEQMQAIHPKILGNKLNELKHPDYQKLLRQHWLDLNDFNLQDTDRIRRICSKQGLSIITKKFIPGGMLGVARYGIIVRKV